MKISLASIALLVGGSQAWVVAPRHQQRATTARSAAITLDGEEIRAPITPLGNFVLVKTKDTLTATGGGILLPDQVRTNERVVCDV